MTTTKHHEPKPNRGRGVKRGEYPMTWCTGPDPRRHKQYYAWLQHRAQATYRNETHELTWPEWETIWNTDSQWEQRGRGSENLCLTMQDPSLGWHKDNVHVITRRLQLQILGWTKTGVERSLHQITRGKK